MSEAHRRRGRTAAVSCTAVQHGSTLVAALGAFVLLFASQTEPVPDGLVSFGVVSIVAGLCGTAAGWLAKRFFSTRARI